MKSLYSKYFIFSRLLFLGIPIFSMMPYYQNKITEIQEIQGAATYTIVLKCSEIEPTAVYAPATYQESLNPDQIRIFLPNTILADGVEPIVGVVEVMGTGIEILLFGKLIKKIASNGIVVVTVKASR